MQSTLPVRISPAFDAVRSWQTSFAQSVPGKAALVLGATGLMAICAHVSVPLYFTPVPITLQTLAVILIGLTLGPVLGSSAMVLYLAEGAMGAPVFSPHGPGGVAQLMGPTGGFLFSYPLAAAAAGYVVRGALFGKARFAAAVLGGAAASVFIFGMGAGWLAYFMHLNVAAAWKTGIAPFAPGELIKMTIAAALYCAVVRDSPTQSQTFEPSDAAKAQ
jgi:biotin transport system substrate-specific component